MKTKWMRSVIIAGLMLVVSCTLGGKGCLGRDKDSNKTDTGSSAPVITLAENVKTLSQATMGMLRSHDGTTYTFDKNASEIQSVAVNDIIASGVGEGLLRRVSAIYQDADTIILDTTDVPLEDVIKEGSFSVSKMLTPDMVKSVAMSKGVTFDRSTTSYTFPVRFNNLVIYESDKAVVSGSASKSFNQTIYQDQLRRASISVSGNIEVTISVELSVDIGLLEGVKKITYVATVRETGSLTAEVSGSISGRAEKRVFTTTLAVIPVIPFILTLTPEFTIDVGAEVEAGASVTTGISQSLTIKGGAEYIKGQGWKKIEEFTKSFDYTPPTASLRAQAKAYAKPQVVLKVNGVAGPSLYASGYLRFNADPTLNPWWSLYAGIEGGVGFEVSIFSWKIVGIDWKLFGREWTIASAPILPPKPPKVTSPNPRHASTNVPITSNLTWSSASGATSYDVYLGTTSPGTSKGNQTKTTYNPSTNFAYSTTYYWRIDPKNSGGTTTGDVYSFQTEAQPVLKPDIVRSPNPSDQSTNVPIPLELKWAAANRADSYDVYFGTSSPGTAIGNQAGTAYNPGTLNYNTTYYWRVDAKNSGGTQTGTVWSFKTLSRPPQVASPTPGDSAVNIPLNQQLGWAVASRAASYDVYFGTTNPPALKTNTNATNYDPGSLIYNTTYYWRVDPKNAAGATTGNTWSFQTIAPPVQVTTPNPANDASNIAITRQLSWDSASGATFYAVYFGTANPPPFKMNAQNTTTYNPGALNYDTTYYWRIDSANLAGKTDGTVWKFRTEPAPLPAVPPQVSDYTPSDGLTGLSINTKVGWTPVARASSYDVYFGTTNPPAYKTNITGGDVYTMVYPFYLYYKPGTLAYSTVYYWRIDPKNAGGTTTGRVVWSFTTEAQPITAPLQVTSPAPANNASSVSITSRLNWAESSGAAAYDVYFGTVNPPPRVQADTTSTTYNSGSNLAYSTVYYWRIDPKNAGGTTAGVAWSFTTEAQPITAPPQVASPAPADNASSVSITSRLSWATSSGAAAYDVYFGTTNPPPHVQADTTSTTYNSGNNLAYSATYYWRIDPKNSGGTTLGTVWSFSTESQPITAPPQVASPVPADTATNVSANQQLRWVAAGGTTSYDVYFGTANPPPFKITTVGTTYNPGVTLSRNTAYYWRVDAKNSGGTTAGNIWSFQTAGQAVWAQIATGGYHASGIKSDGTLWAWGLNDVGQLGLGDTRDRLTPVKVGADTNWKTVAVGFDHSLALKTDGTLWGWGQNMYGELGLNDLITRTVPTQVGTDTNWKEIAAGFDHSAAIKTDGTLWGWGWNDFAELGLDDTVPRDQPTLVGTDTNWKTVATGWDYTLAIKTDGTLWVWGDNYFGELGLSDLTERTVPTQLNADTNWKEITTGSWHTLAIKTDGTLWGWGWNEYGQLGLGDTNERLAPVQVGTDASWKTVAGSYVHTLAVKNNGTLWASGWNGVGQLGLDDTVTRTALTQVGIDTNWQSVAVDFYHSLALKSDGTLWAWGWNAYGQLGLGDTNNRSVPMTRIEQ